jgi:glycerate 2-kinase
MQYLKLEELLDRADLAITAEGCLDGQSPLGKVPCEVARRAKRRGIPVIALAGSIGKDARTTLAHGIDAFASIVRHPCTLDEAESALRMIAVGIGLNGRSGRSQAAAQRQPRW